MLDVGIVATQAYLPRRRSAIRDILAARAPIPVGSNDRLLQASYAENLQMHGVGLDRLAVARIGTDAQNFADEAGIHTVAVESEMPVSEMMTLTVRRLIEAAKANGWTGEISTFLVCQSSFEHDLTVSSACRLQCELRQGQTPFAVGQHQGASFLLALSIAQDLMHCEPSLHTVVLAAAERWSAPYPRIIGTTTALGDGAGAVLLRRGLHKGWAIRTITVTTRAGAPDIYGHIVQGKRCPVDRDALCGLVLQTLHDAGLRPDDIDLVVPQHLNPRFAAIVFQRCGFRASAAAPDHFGDGGGYLCSAETPVRLHQALQGATPRPGQRLLTWATGFSGGLGCAVLEYCDGRGEAPQGQEEHHG